MLITNCNNFEIFGSPYCLLSIDLPILATPTLKLCIFSKNTHPPLLIYPFYSVPKSILTRNRHHMNYGIFSRYWNGSGSLQTNKKFQKIAGELISRDLNKSRKLSDSDALELESRDKELADMRTQLKRVQMENERIKKRLQNEEEIQRTIEMTDQDLVSKLEMTFR